MANLIDFLNDFKHILKVNDRITRFFVIYVFISFIASLLAPSTVLLMIIDTFIGGFGNNFLKLNSTVNTLILIDTQ